MPEPGTEAAERAARLSGLLKEAEERNERVTSVGTKVVRTAQHKLRKSASSGAGSRVFELVMQGGVFGSGSLWYVVIALVGIFYSMGYWQFHGIQIFDYFGTQDFLLSAFDNPLAVLAGGTVPFVLLTSMGVKYFVSNVHRAEVSAHDERPWRVRPVILRIGAIVVGSLLGLASTMGLGAWDSSRALTDKSRLVRLTLLSDSTQPETRVPTPGRTILLGKTSGYHLFLECTQPEDLESTQVLPGSEKCEGTRAFIVSTANVASLSFNLDAPEPNGIDPNPCATDPVEGGCRTPLERVCSVGPFPVGEHIPDGGPDGDAIRQRLAAVESLFRYDPPRHVMMVGRIDTTQLSPEASKEYGYGSGLAQARARRVWESLRGGLKDEGSAELREVVNRALLLSAGPMHTNPETNAEPSATNCPQTGDTRSLDRIVEVWACWDGIGQQAALDALAPQMREAGCRPESES